MKPKTFTNQLTMAANEFRENLSSYRQVISVHHTDADGYSSGAIIQQMMGRFRTPFVQFAFNLKKPWKEFLTDLIPKMKSPCAVIFSDLCPSAADLISLANQLPESHVYILDHHVFQSLSDQSLPASIYDCNPTHFGLDGLKEIAGATLNYLFAKEVDESNSRNGWLAALGMGGDTLNHFNEYQSFNRQVIEEAAKNGLVEIRDGLCAFGGMYESVEKGMAMSILPYLELLQGSQEKATEFLKALGIDGKTKIIDLFPDQINQIANSFTNVDLKGKYITFPKKQGLLHHQFEHAHLLGLIGYDRPQPARYLIASTRVSSELRLKFVDYIRGIVSNLTTFIKIPKVETNTAILTDTTGKIAANAWSDTASFASINKIYNPSKILFLGGQDGQELKFSVRADTKFLKAHHGKGANAVVNFLIQKIGGRGGGHPLAAGYHIPPNKFNLIQQIIDDIVQTL